MPRERLEILNAGVFHRRGLAGSMGIPMHEPPEILGFCAKKNYPTFS
jgi:hypothetical protein